VDTEKRETTNRAAVVSTDAHQHVLIDVVPRTSDVPTRQSLSGQRTTRYLRVAVTSQR